MNQLATNNERLPMDSVGMSTGSTGMKIAPQNLAEVVKFAEVMCRADIALPKHLRGNAGACMAVSLQALDWQMNPFAVASKSYQVNGTIAYEAQLIMAVINTRSGIEGRLKFKFEGEGADRICIAYGKLDGDELEVRSPKFKDITPKNSPLWKSDPDQQHCYYTARAWGRRYTPEVILGVYDRDEAEQFQGPDNARDITPSRPSLSDRLQQASSAAQTSQDAREGFSTTFDRAEPEFVPAGEYDDFTNSDDIPSSDDAAPPVASEAGDTAPSDTPASSLFADDDQRPSDKEMERLRAYAKDVLNTAGNPSTTADLMKKVEGRWATEISGFSQPAKNIAGGIARSVRAIMRGDTSAESAIMFHAEGLGVEPEEIGGVK